MHSHKSEPKGPLALPGTAPGLGRYTLAGTREEQNKCREFNTDPTPGEYILKTLSLTHVHGDCFIFLVGGD